MFGLELFRYRLEFPLQTVHRLLHLAKRKTQHEMGHMIDYCTQLRLCSVHANILTVSVISLSVSCSELDIVDIGDHGAY